jgi:ABC-type glutathione transport system ATPase component
MSASKPLDLRHLRKQFGAVAALKGVSFSVEDGEVFGYLGPNGAGKTTTLRIVLGLVRPPGIIRSRTRWRQPSRSRWARAVAGEIENGAMELILAQPVSRFNYLATHLIFAMVSMALVVFFGAARRIPRPDDFSN